MSYGDRDFLILGFRCSKRRNTRETGTVFGIVIRRLIRVKEP